MTPTTTRQRHTKAELADIRAAIRVALEADHPMTVRQIFYRLVVRGVVPKDENRGYGVVQRELTGMRDSWEIRPDWIIDGVRRVRRPYTVLSFEEALTDTADQYRRHVWDNQPALVMIVVEKLALAGVLEEVTDPWDVPLVPVQGFASISLIYQAARIILAARKPAFVYYFGDWDPSGALIPQSFERRLRSYAPGCDISFNREAINPDQIETWGLPGRPTKREGNRHAKGFVGDSVELDALEPARLRDMIRSCIERHVDQHALHILRAAETSEREIMTRLANADTTVLHEWLEAGR